MRKLKIYLDTSVISHLFADDVPEKMAETLALWEELKAGKYVAVLSNVTIAELNKCGEPKKAAMFSCINEIPYEVVDETADSLALAEDYLKFGVLREKSRDDCRHIAVATLAGCQYIVSWNFKHFVNIKTVNKVQAVNKMAGYPEVSIVPPSMMLGGID